MSADNVRALPGSKVPTSEPNQQLIDILRKTLAQAEAGYLQSLIGVGFVVDGGRLSIWCDTHKNVYEMLGSIEWMKDEYITRRKEND